MIVDTSSILFALSNKVDIFNAVRAELGMTPMISKGVINELTRISNDTRANGRYAKVALRLIDRYGVKTDPDSGYVDDWMLSKANDPANFCTNDTKLRNALKGKGAKVYAISRSGEFR
jgi:rRNA-processing protein FCF1